MNKSAINYKEVRKYIIDSRLNGKTDREIYAELSDKDDDKKTIARMIAGMVTKDRKEKYRILNSIYLILILVVIIFHFIPVLKMVLESFDIWSFLFFLIGPSIYILFFYVANRYNATMYPVVGIWAILGFINKLWSLKDGTHTIGETIEGIKKISVTINTEGVDYLIYVISLCGIIFLSFYLKRKLLPYKPHDLIKDSA